MKKALIYAVVFVVLSCFGGFACADDEFATFDALYGSWHEKEQVGHEVTVGKCVYPEGVSGVWSTDGGTENFTVGITADARGEKAKADILAAVRDEASISFVTQKYSYSELLEVKEKVSEFVNAYEGPELGAAGWGIYQIDNKVHVEIIESKPGARDFIDWGYENFGDMIVFNGTQGYDIPASASISVDTDGAIHGGVIAAAAAIIIIAAAVLAVRKKLFKDRGEA